MAAGSSVLLGALAALLLRLPSRAIGLILAFGAGTLISAMAFELTDEAFRLGGADAVAIGLAAGALTFFAGDLMIERRGAARRMSHTDRPSGASSTALLLGAILDGIPESAVIGMTLLGGGGVGMAVVAAVFLSNLPEALSASTGMRNAGHSRGHVLGTWAAVMLVCGIASGLGYVLLEGASPNTVGLVQAFAGGAVLTMLASTMIPEALEHGGKPAGLITVLGFALAYLLSTLQ